MGVITYGSGEWTREPTERDCFSEKVWNPWFLKPDHPIADICDMFAKLYPVELSELVVVVSFVFCAQRVVPRREYQRLSVREMRDLA